MEHEIFNHRHYRDFTIIPNEILQARDIPPYTLGILCHLLSLPDSWVVNIGALARRFGDSETKISRALKDLIALGYCKRTPKRENGRVCGQRYQITDIRNDFSDPSIFRGAENEKTVAETAVSVEKDVYNKNINIKNIDNKNININKQEEKKEIRASASNTHDEPLCLFADSKFSDFESFAAEFSGDDYAGVDIRYYYEVVRNWSASKRAKKNDWIATARGIMFRDYKEGKLIRQKPANGLTGNLSEDDLYYLQMMHDDGDLWAK